MWANWNGTMMPLEEVRVCVLDRAFMFGDAVYEALRLYSGKPWLLNEHAARLKRNLAELRIPCDVARLTERMHQTVEHSGAGDGLVYVQVTRGEGPRTHAFPENCTPNELIFVREYDRDPHEAYRDSGVKCVTVADQRWGRCDIKSVNLLANCLASQQARDAGCFEAILIGTDGAVTEGSHTSIFAVDEEGRLLTAPKSRQILPGITRSLVLELARRAQIPVKEQAVRKDDLDRVSELFLTGTTTEVLAITHVDGRPIGSGEPGPISQSLHQTYRQTVREWLAAGAPCS